MLPDSLVGCDRIKRSDQAGIRIKTGLIHREKSKSLHKAFDLRQLADYQELTLIDINDAKEILEKAEEFVHSVDDFLK